MSIFSIRERFFISFFGKEIFLYSLGEVLCECRSNVQLAQTYRSALTVLNHSEFATTLTYERSHTDPAHSELLSQE